MHSLYQVAFYQRQVYLVYWCSVITGEFALVYLQLRIIYMCCVFVFSLLYKHALFPTHSLSLSLSLSL